MPIAGISIVVPVGDSSQIVLTVDAAQYIRVAGIISAAGFAVGFDPTVFNGLLSRLNLGQAVPAAKTPLAVSAGQAVAAPAQDGQSPQTGQK